VPCDVPDRTNLIKSDEINEENDMEQSDMVSILLNLAFVPEFVAGKFEFKNGFSKEFKLAIQ